MGTICRKVQFEIHDKDHEQTILVGKHATFKFNPNTISGEELTDFLSSCEEIPDNSPQIEKLEVEKKELLDILYNARLALSKYDDQLSYDILSIIQKHKL